MKKHYKNKKWIEFREEIFELDNYTCTKCRRTSSEVTLQVHHKTYIKGKYPWEYQFNLCETLCKGCHASEHGIIMPRDGWEFAGDEDLGGLDGICDLCNTEFRYAFHIIHPNWEPMVVGTYCCDMLTGTIEASEIRKFDDRLKRFYKSKRWKKDTEYDLHFIKQKQKNITIGKVANGYKIRINSIDGKSRYPTLEEAKKRVFKFLEQEDSDRFFENYSKKPNKT